MIYKYPNTIKEAAELLDKARPKWEYQVKDIDMSTGETCILGQIFSHYLDGMEELFGLHLGDDEEDDVYTTDNVFGKKACVNDWKKEIQSRKEGFLWDINGRTVLVDTTYGLTFIAQVAPHVYQFIGVGDSGCGGPNRHTESFSVPTHKMTTGEIHKAYKPGDINDIYYGKVEVKRENNS